MFRILTVSEVSVLTLCYVTCMLTIYDACSSAYSFFTFHVFMVSDVTYPKGLSKVKKIQKSITDLDRTLKS